MSYYEEKPIRRNLRCPHCGGDDLAFVTEYHKAYGWRLLESIFLILSIVFAIVGFLKKALGAEVIPFLVLWFICHAIRSYVESKTHVQAICRVCGNYWLLT